MARAATGLHTATSAGRRGQHRRRLTHRKPRGEWRCRIETRRRPGASPRCRSSATPHTAPPTPRGPTSSRVCGRRNLAATPRTRHPPTAGGTRPRSARRTARGSQHRPARAWHPLRPPAPRAPPGTHQASTVLLCRRSPGHQQSRCTRTAATNAGPRRRTGRSP